MNLVPTMVVFICSGCGASYGAAQRSGLETQSCEFRCTSCETVVYSWSAGYTYTDWEAIDLARLAVTALPRKKKRARKRVPPIRQAQPHRSRG